MPLVHLYDNRTFREDPKILRIAIREIVAAALHVDPEVGEGQLTPNDIIVMHQVTDEIETDILLVIEAFPYPERQKNIDERSELILSVLDDYIFEKQYTFAVAITPLSSWVSSAKDVEPAFEGEMTMEAAFNRALTQIFEIRSEYTLKQVDDLYEAGFPRAAVRLASIATHEAGIRPGEPV